MDSKTPFGRQTYTGLFLIAMAALMYEILLTRIFSVTMWYHFAFVAVSVAMFGMTVGALLVYLWPSLFPPDRVHQHLTWSSLAFAFMMSVSLVAHMSIPFVVPKSLLTLILMAFNYLVISVPFVFSGIAVCLALTQFPRQFSSLYAADLAGAATGCILAVAILRVADAPSAIVMVSGLAAAGSMLFASGDYSSRLRRIAMVCGALAVGFAAWSGYRAVTNRPWLKLTWAKGRPEKDTLYEKWNSYSRIRVYGDPAKAKVPWGVSPACPAKRVSRELNLTIDSTADTPLTFFDGDLRRVQYLKCSATNMVYALRPDSQVLIVGTGGGRDILSALAFQQRSIVGVELNPEIVSAVDNTFGSFTGHLDRNPRVRLVADEARSYLARHQDRYDVIQISFIDTWAATAAGAFVLSENSLYTVEAWKVFLSRLHPRGVLAVSRWYFRDRPAEIYRLTALAARALREAGVNQPRDHLIVVRQWLAEHDGVEGIGTLLVGKDPFTEKDVIVAREFAQRLEFDLVLSPDASLDPTFVEIASSPNLDRLTADYPLNIAPPTDDSPFFFHMLRFRNILNRQLQRQGAASANLQAVAILVGLLGTVCVLTLLCIIIPLVITFRGTALRGTIPLFVYFASIGIGFMLVEISQMQRLIVFLGHPTYGLSVVLFALLLASGLGSLSTRGSHLSAPARLLSLLAVVVIFGALSPFVIDRFREATTAVRIIVAAGILVPLGILLGMALPLGMRAAANRSASLTPWLWGINGATSVVASVAAVVIALGSGITASFWSGFAAYALGIGVLIVTRQLKVPGETS
ncbi:MAG: hypothetical protein HY508_14930 [Acidobacteria bacterium]|nr:hypothetical protein [Acidobacteriota bacterium]